MKQSRSSKPRELWDYSCSVVSQIVSRICLEPVPIGYDESGTYNMRDLDGLLIN
jgi:hypothetical protein